MGFRYALFDLDGTLIDTNRLILDSFKYTYKTCLGLDVSEQEILRCLGEPLIELPYLRVFRSFWISLWKMAVSLPLLPPKEGR